MPTGDGVQKQPSFEDQVKVFKGYTTREGEILDPKDENLNPTKQNISEEERKAGTKTVAEAAKEAADGDDNDGAVKAGDTPGKGAKSTAGGEGAAGSDDSSDDVGGDSDGDDEGEDDTKTVTVAEAKKMAASAAGKRIAALTKDKRTLERSLDTMADRLERLEARLTAPVKAVTETDIGAPEPDKFDLGEMDPQYIRALARYEARQESLVVKREDEAKQQREAANREQREFAQKKTALEEAGSAEYDDFSEVVIEGAKWSLQNQDAPEAWPLSNTIGELAFASKEAGHKVLYHLATHPDEARKVFAMSQGAQGAWFARKELELAPPPASGAPGDKPQIKTSKALPPPKYKGRGGNGTATPVPTDSNDFAAVEAGWRNSSQRRPN